MPSVDRRRLVVTGTHSSGKNYTNRILYELGFRNFLQEPLSPLSPPGIWLGKKSYLYTYCDTRSPKSKQALIKRKLFQPTGLPVFAKPASIRDYAALWKAALIRIGLWYSGRSFVIKDPFCLFVADLLKSDCGIAPWIIIRHPADFVANSLRNNTPFQFGSLATDTEFEQRLGDDFRELRTYASHPDRQTLFHENLSYWMVCALLALYYGKQWSAGSQYAFNLLDSINTDSVGVMETSLERLGFRVARDELAMAIDRASGPAMQLAELSRLQQTAETLTKPTPQQRLKPLTSSMLGEIDRVALETYAKLERLEALLSQKRANADAYTSD